MTSLAENTLFMILGDSYESLEKCTNPAQNSCIFPIVRDKAYATLCLDRFWITLVVIDLTWKVSQNFPHLEKFLYLFYYPHPYFSVQIPKQILLHLKPCKIFGKPTFRIHWTPGYRLMKPKFGNNFHCTHRASLDRWNGVRSWSKLNGLPTPPCGFQLFSHLSSIKSEFFARELRLNVHCSLLGGS